MAKKKLPQTEVKIKLFSASPLAQYRFVIGIDTGTHTGFAVWDRKERRFHCIETLKVHDCIISLYEYCRQGMKEQLFVRVEDARKRKWYGDNAQQKLMGAGSIRRDAKIIEDCLTDLGIAFELVAPAAGMTKWKEETFQRITGWKGVTSNHARDAACLVYQK